MEEAVFKSEATNSSASFVFMRPFNALVIKDFLCVPFSSRKMLALSSAKYAQILGTSTLSSSEISTMSSSLLQIRQVLQQQLSPKL